MNETIVFEFPLSERIRVFMRLEQLFLQLDHFMEGDNVWNTRAVIACLLDILTIFSRHELKAEVLKELDRHATVLSGIAQNQNVDSSKLETLVEEIERISSALYSTSGKIGLSLMDSELFKNISQRSSIPGGTYSFDLPEYHYWLQQDAKRRAQDLNQWLRPFKTIREALELILRLIRQSSMPSHERAKAGFFQQALDRNQPYQLLRIELHRQLPYYAEISGGKHRFTVRFMSANTDDRPVQTDQDVDFSLIRCRFG